MDIKLEKKIIKEYKKGKSSLDIVKIVGLSKRTILKVLNKHNLVRKRDRCSKLDIKEDGEKYYVIRKCPKCGKEIKTISKDKGIACRNHFIKVDNDRMCKPCSQSLQVGKGNPFFGKKHTKETIDKMSKSREGKLIGKDNPMANPKWREKATRNLKKKWDNGDMEHARKIMSEKLKETRRLGKIKSTITSKKEKELGEFLTSLGIVFISSYRVDSKICDIYIPSFNLIIEYFGDYWHCNPCKYDENYFNQKKNLYAKEIWDYDRKKIDLLINYGYNLEILWESDLKYSNEKIITILNKYDTKNNSNTK
jgi:G:T-mismatch repair DNA endonuclease (very short patch repair protein)